MKEITIYECEYCKKRFDAMAGCRQCEQLCKRGRAGHAVWWEHGEAKHAPRIPSQIFGGHSYKENRTSDCAYGCGCWTGHSRSGGPVDPFGPCPKNPRDVPLKEESADGQKRQ